MRFRPSLALIVVRACTVAITATSCARSEPARSPGERDDFGRVAPRGRAMRIVSLNPATTELLFALGAGARVIGRTHWDSWPDSARLVRDLGDGIRPNVEIVIAAHPDLVVLYASNDNRVAAERLESAGIRTIALKIDRFADLRRAARILGLATGDSARAARTVDTVAHTLDSVRIATAALPRVRAFWHVWDSPLITIGSGSYLDSLLATAGGTNIYHDLAQPSPQVSLEDVARRNPDVILAGASGKAVILGDTRWRGVPAATDARILVADTNLVGRPSVRLGEAAVHIARLLHPATR